MRLAMDGHTVLPPDTWLVDGDRLGDPAGAPHRVAMLVVHGMGQQSRFDTLGGLAQCLVQQANSLPTSNLPAAPTTPPNDGGVTVVPRLRALSGVFGREKAECLAMDVNGGDGSVAGTVHLYEAYWAPLTEGVVKLSDVVRFLVGSGLHGLRTWLAGFDRRIFNHTYHYRMPVWAAVQLLFALLVVVSLVVLNAVIAYVQGKRLLGGGSEVGEGAVPLVTSLIMLVLIAAAAFGVSVAASHRFPKVRGLRIATLFTFMVALLAVILGAAFAVVILVAEPKCAAPPGIWSPFCASVLRAFLGHENTTAAGRWFLLLVAGGVALVFVLRLVRYLMRRRDGIQVARERISLSFQLTRVLTIGTLVLAAVGIFAAAGLARTTAPGNPWYDTVVWGLLLVLSWHVRGILVQYVGDVAAYVSSHSLDRFHETRERIRTTVYRALRHLYAARVDGAYVYDHVIVVGHSLGSVLAYDVLNRLIAEDEAITPADSGGNGNQPHRASSDVAASGEAMHVLERTPLLLTFGSPLDKTAFLFAQQAEEQIPARRLLATTAQAMLIHPTLRPGRWINVWSPWDVISGPLEFYDPPAEDLVPSDRHAKRVENQVDPEASTLLVAHVQYWRSAAIYTPILNALADIFARRADRSTALSASPSGT